MKLPVSYLFVPGDRPDRFAKALASAADAVIIDLEDAVSADNKSPARDHVRAWHASRARDQDRAGGSERVLLRINDASTAWFEADLELARECSIDGVVLPKAEHPRDISRAAGSLAKRGFVVPLIETARGVQAVDELASVDGVQRFAFGTLDYAFDLGLSGDERGLLYPACRMAIASKVAGIASPIAGVTTEIDNDARLDADLAFARACGFGAKLCIHPRQLALTQRAFAPTAEEIAWAQRVIAAVQSGRGAVQVDGKMVDRPVILHAQAILERAS
ncbi:MAG TPA: CoA ester lyase [Casimicrobiaceae bacterium]|nr:CoA ester lyase [Casimicrobiaceae bacterium]